MFSLEVVVQSLRFRMSSNRTPLCSDVRLLYMYVRLSAIAGIVGVFVLHRRSIPLESARKPSTILWSNVLELSSKQNGRGVLVLVVRKMFLSLSTKNCATDSPCSLHPNRRCFHVLGSLFCGDICAGKARVNVFRTTVVWFLHFSECFVLAMLRERFFWF